MQLEDTKDTQYSSAFPEYCNLDDNEDDVSLTSPRQTLHSLMQLEDTKDTHSSTFAEYYNLDDNENDVSLTRPRQTLHSLMQLEDTKGTHSSAFPEYCNLDNEDDVSLTMPRQTLHSLMQLEDTKDTHSSAFPEYYNLDDNEDDISLTRPCQTFHSLMQLEDTKDTHSSAFPVTMKTMICQVRTWFGKLLAGSGRSKTSSTDKKNEGKVGCFPKLFCRRDKDKRAAKERIEESATANQPDIDETSDGNFLQRSVLEQNHGETSLAGEELDSIFNIFSYANYTNQEEEQEEEEEEEPIEPEIVRLPSHEITENDFELLTLIGEGTFGQVRLCKERTTGHLYAMKKIKKATMIEMDMMHNAQAEQRLLSRLNNDFIVKLYCSFEDEEHLYLVMEYYPGGDLNNLITDYVTFNEDEARFYIAQTIVAIEQVHTMNYVHRDIKPDNILLDRRGHVKLCDFGLCQDLSSSDEADAGQLQKHMEASSSRVDETRQQPMSKIEQLEYWQENRRKLAFSIVGTPDYVAPEILDGEGYGMECDWWSLGAMLYHMLVGYTPFESGGVSTTYSKIRNWDCHLQFPLNLSDEALDLMKKLLCNADERLGNRGADEIKFHPWFKGVEWDKLQEMEAPYIPQINDELDTQNFNNFVHFYSPFDSDSLISESTSSRKISPWFTSSECIKLSSRKATEWKKKARQSALT